MINLSKQSIDRNDLKKIREVFLSGKVARGKNIINFEKKISKYTGCKYAVAVNSASSALLLAYSVLLNKKNKITWTTPITFISTISSSMHLGSKVDFVDVGHDFNINIKSLENKLKKSKKKDIPTVLTSVHLRGIPTDQDKLMNLKKKYNFKIIEDASHSLGAEFKSEKVGSCRWSDMTILSFHPSKSITTAEGGMILTNNLNYYHKLSLLRNNGIKKNKNSPWNYRYDSIGYNFWMNEFQAALGISQLKKLDRLIKMRKNKADYYDAQLKNTDFYVNSKYLNKKSSYHLYVIKCKNKIIKNKMMKYLFKKGIETATHYTALNLQPFFLKHKFKNQKLENAERYTNSHLSIPIYPDITKKKQDYIINCILNFK